MSGHSKWSSIKHKKAAVDAKRGKIFTKLIKELEVAARMGGSDPGGNPRLRTAMQAARDANMPNDTMNRAVKKGAGELAGVQYEDFLIEGYGQAGVAIMVEGTTDNKNRTMPELRHMFGKYGGAMGEQGCVGWMFNRQGVIIASAEGIDEDAAMETALNAGAEDFVRIDQSFRITTGPNEVDAVREALEAGKLKIEASSVENIPTNTIKVEGDEALKLLKLIEMLEDHDDVKAVWANYEIDDSVIEQYAG